MDLETNQLQAESQYRSGRPDLEAGLNSALFLTSRPYFFCD